MALHASPQAARTLISLALSLLIGSPEPQFGQTFARAAILPKSCGMTVLQQIELSILEAAAMAMSPERLDAALIAGGADTSRGVYSIDVISITAADIAAVGAMELTLAAMLATAAALALRKTVAALASSAVTVAALAMLATI